MVLHDTTNLLRTLRLLGHLGSQLLTYVVRHVHTLIDSALFNVIGKHLPVFLNKPQNLQEVTVEGT